MCKYVSVIATTNGPLQIYAAPGLNSHGDARAGWKLTDPGAEVEWVDESPQYLTVRHEDTDVARTVRQLILDRWPTRSAMLASITETRSHDGSKEWYRDEQRHRDDGPAIEWSDGSKEWYRNGKLHRDDGPTIERANGYKAWYRDGKRHRDDGPAIEWPDGSKEWYRDGKRHRDDSPAIERANGYKEWYRNGKLHRNDGPTIKRPMERARK